MFGLGIDQMSRAHLSEAAKWARFLAICGFVLLGLMVIYGIGISIVFTNMMSSYDEMPVDYRGSGLRGILGIWMSVFYIICAVIAFFPYFFLFRFANKMKAALLSNDQTVLNDSFMNLKILYRYMGIVTIIGLAFMILGVFSIFMTAVFVR